MNSTNTHYAQANTFSVPTIDANITLAPTVHFQDMKVGDHFLRVTKKGNGQVLLKIGKRNATLILDSKGRDSEVKKFKKQERVIPLSSELKLDVAPLTESGKLELERRMLNKERIASLKAPITFKGRRFGDQFPYPPVDQQQQVGGAALTA